MSDIEEYERESREPTEARVSTIAAVASENVQCPSCGESEEVFGSMEMLKDTLEIICGMCGTTAEWKSQDEKLKLYSYDELEVPE